MVLLSAPVWLLMGLAALLILFVPWRRALTARGTALSASRWPVVVCAAIAIPGAIFGATSLTPDGWAWFIGHGLWLTALMIGLGYVTVSLLVWRVWFAFRKSASFAWSLVPAFLVLWLPAFPITLGAGYDPSWTSGYFNLLAGAGLAGIYGLPTLGVLLILNVEARGAMRRATELADPVRPDA
jgi:hypothetical protein